MSDIQGDPYVADAPVKDPDQDLFRRWPFSQRIAKVIASRKDPSSIVIAINGAWGEGKTTVLNFIERELRNHEHIVVFRFNPWQFSDEGKLLLGFFNSLAEAVGRSVTNNREKTGDWISKYGTIAASLFGQGDTARELGSALATVEIEDLRQRVEGILRGEGRRVVVLMDDIDRLDKNEVQAVFRLLKITADFDYTAYVLAFDDEMVAAALQERYSSNYSDAGRNFLEKIVQIPLNMPAISKYSLREYFFRSVDQALKDAEIALSDIQTQTFLRYFLQTMEIRIRTPRMAKRYSNILAFSLPILKGEVNMIDLMLIEGIRVLYPNLYDTIRNNPDVFLGRIFNRYGAFEQQKQRAVEVVEQGTKDLQYDEKEAVTELISALFPRLNIILGKIQYGDDWEKSWAKEQRICSIAYFPRYFSYAVPEGEVSDNELTELLSRVSTMTIEDIADYLRTEIGIARVASFISQLRPRHKEFTYETARRIALAVASNGHLFPRTQQLYSFLGVFSQSAILVSNLIRTIPKDNGRLDLAKEVLSLTEPLAFVIEINHWLPVGETNEEKVYSDEEEQELHRIVVSRIQQALTAEKTIFELYPDAVAMILSTWARYNGGSDVSNYIRNLLAVNTNFAQQLLMAYVPTAWSLEIGISFKSDLDKSQYDAIAELIDPGEILDALPLASVADINNEHFPRDYTLSIEERIMRQFVWLHNLKLQGGLSGEA